MARIKRKDKRHRTVRLRDLDIDDMLSLISLSSDDSQWASTSFGNVETAERFYREHMHMFLTMDTTSNAHPFNHGPGERADAVWRWTLIPDHGPVRRIVPDPESPETTTELPMQWSGSQPYECQAAYLHRIDAMSAEEEELVWQEFSINRKVRYCFRRPWIWWHRESPQPRDPAKWELAQLIQLDALSEREREILDHPGVLRNDVRHLFDEELLLLGIQFAA